MTNKIANWDNLTQEQQHTALKLLEGQAGMNPAVVHPAAKFFEKNHWVKIDKFIDQNMANLLYHHVQLETKRLNYLDETLGKGNYDTDYFGTFEDSQAPGDFSKYGEPIFDTLLNLGVEQMEMLTGKKLVPTYSYHRLYTTGTELKRHKDRPSCEISTTLCLGYDVSNVDSKKYPNWDWPMFVKETNGTEVPVHMKPGDMIIYRGCEVEHWREPFWGKNHAQVFLHYNEKEGQYNIPYDGRPVLGLPASFRAKNALEKNESMSYDANTNKNINTDTNNNITVSKKIIY
jgi:hypothetical protein